MKKHFLNLMVAIVLTIVSIQAFAQDGEQIEQKLTTPKWVSEKGYWVIENNMKTPKNNIVYFYTNDNELVYKEKVEGIKINTNRKKVLMHLKDVLEQSVTAWEHKHIMQENQTLVALALK